MGCTFLLLILVLCGAGILPTWLAIVLVILVALSDH